MDAWRLTEAGARLEIVCCGMRRTRMWDFNNVIKKNQYGVHMCGVGHFMIHARSYMVRHTIQYDYGHNTLRLSVIVTKCKILVTAHCEPLPHPHGRRPDALLCAASAFVRLALAAPDTDRMSCASVLALLTADPVIDWR